MAMTELTHSSLYAFLKRFQFQGGSLRLYKIRHTKKQTVATLVTRVFDQQAKKKVRLRFTVYNVEEYRFQRRPGPHSPRLSNVQFGFFGAFAYFNLDAFAEDGPPKVMDFRASDCFIAGTRIDWELIEPKTA